MHCELRTAEKTLFSGEAELVVARSPRGEFGIMNGHAPLLAALVPAPLRVKAGGQEYRFAVSSGLLRVDKSGVTVLAQEAIPAEEVDVASVRSRIAKLADAEGTEEELAFLRVQEMIRGTGG